MGNEGPLLTCMVVDVVGTVDWALLVVPGRLATVNVGLSVSCGRNQTEARQHSEQHYNSSTQHTNPTAVWFQSEASSALLQHTMTL